MVDSEKPRIKCLIATSDEELLSKLKKAPELKSFDCHFASNGGDAQKIIKENTYLINMAFIDPDLKNPTGLDVIKFCHLFQTAVPVYLYTDRKDDEDISSLELDKLGIVKIVEQTTELEVISKIIEPYKVEFSQEQALEIAKKFNDKEGQELNAIDKEFQPVQAANFISGQKSFFDIYVRLKSGKYVKILNAGDDFKFDRVKSYLDKGVVYFFIRKESQKVFLDYINNTAGKILKSAAVSVTAKTQQLLFLGEETGKLLSQFDLDEENITYAAEYVDKLHTQIKAIKDNSQVGNFLNNVLMFEHCSGVAFISGILAKELNVDSYKSISILGTAAILHDIGLYRYREEFTAGYDDVEYFDEENIEHRLNIFWDDREVPGKDKMEELEEIYLKHPMKGSNSIEAIPKTDPLVAQIVRQHHLRRNGEGIAKKKKDEIIHATSRDCGYQR